MSIESFISACEDAVPVFKKMVDNGMTEVLTLTETGRRIIYWSNIENYLDELKSEAESLKDYQHIVDYIVGDKWPSSSEDEDQDAFDPIKYLRTVQSRLNEFICVELGDKIASDLRCPNNKPLYNLANEFNCFRRAAFKLNSAKCAGINLLDGQGGDNNLIGEVKDGLWWIVEFHKKEFTKIVECSPDPEDDLFAFKKRELYKKYRHRFENFMKMLRQEAAVHIEKKGVGEKHSVDRYLIIVMARHKEKTIGDMFEKAKKIIEKVDSTTKDQLEVLFFDEKNLGELLEGDVTQHNCRIDEMYNFCFISK